MRREDIDPLGARLGVCGCAPAEAIPALDDQGRQADSESPDREVSKNLWHLEVKLAAPQDLDAELLGWLRDAYDFCA